MDRDHLKRVIEALIFASDAPISLAQLSMILADVAKEDIELCIDQLKSEYGDRAFALKKVSGGFELVTRPEYGRWLKALYESKSRSRLTRAALETLAIIAFKQPISRVEISAIRGVNSDGVMKSLLEKRMVTISGRAASQGRPLLFSTTKDFLRYFGINDISDLPKPKEIDALLAEGEAGRIFEEIGEREPGGDKVSSDNPPADGSADDSQAQPPDDDGPTEWIAEKKPVVDSAARNAED
jgi:segregation and condensation protein B